MNRSHLAIVVVAVTALAPSAAADKPADPKTVLKAKAGVFADGKVKDFDLGQLLAGIEQKHGLKFVVDEKAFREGANPDLENVLKYKLKNDVGKNLTVGGLLTAALKEIDAGYTVTKDGVTIAPKKK